MSMITQETTPRSRAQLDTRALARQSLIQEAADDIFWRNDRACLDLKVIVIGSYGPEEEDEGVHHFLRPKQIEVDDELTAVALPVKRHMVKYQSLVLRFWSGRPLGSPRCGDALNSRIEPFHGPAIPELRVDNGQWVRPAGAYQKYFAFLRDGIDCKNVYTIYSKQPTCVTTDFVSTSHLLRDFQIH
jgi:hypothetical protein